jgi:hypothetical protein
MGMGRTFGPNAQQGLLGMSPSLFHAIDFFIGDFWFFKEKFNIFLVNHVVIFMDGVMIAVRDGRIFEIVSC